MKETNALFHLNLDNSDTGKTEKLLLEFNHKELLDFYNKVRMLFEVKLKCVALDQVLE